MTNGNTISMKTAISIPDELFEEVTKLAAKNKTSRSKKTKKRLAIKREMLAARANKKRRK